MAFAGAELGESRPFAPREFKLMFGDFWWLGVKDGVRRMSFNGLRDEFGVERFQGSVVNRWA